MPLYTGIVPDHPSLHSNAGSTPGQRSRWNGRDSATACKAPHDAPETATCGIICEHCLSTLPKRGQLLELSDVQHRPSQKDHAETALAAGPDVDVCRCKGSCQVVCACHPQALGCRWSVQVDELLAKTCRLTGIVHRILHCQFTVASD